MTVYNRPGVVCGFVRVRLSNVFFPFFFLIEIEILFCDLLKLLPYISTCHWNFLQSVKPLSSFNHAGVQPMHAAFLALHILV